MRIIHTNLYNQTNTITSTDSSNPFQVEYLKGFSLQIVYQATGLVVVDEPLLSITFVVEASNDFGLPNTTTPTWSTISSQRVTNTSGNVLFNVTDTKSPHYRLTTSVDIGQVDDLKVYLYAKQY